MNEPFSKALLGHADRILESGDASNVDGSEFERAMMNYADSRRLSGESAAAAFARLHAAGDEVVRKCWAVSDLARVQKAHSPVLQQYRKTAAGVHGLVLEEFVRKNMRNDETYGQALARLSLESEDFARLYQNDVEARRHL